VCLSFLSISVCASQTGRIRVCLYLSFCWLRGVMCDYLLVCICVCVAQTGRISKSSYASMSVCDLIRVLCLYEFSCASMSVQEDVRRCQRVYDFSYGSHVCVNYLWRVSLCEGTHVFMSMCVSTSVYVSLILMCFYVSARGGTCLCLCRCSRVSESV